MARAFRPVKRLLPTGLLGRSLLILITPMVLLQVVTTIIFYERHWDTVTQRLSRGLAGDIGHVIAMMAAYPGPENLIWIFEAARQHYNLRVSLRVGGILPNHPVRPTYSILNRELSSALRGQVRRPYMIDADSYDRQVRIDIQLREGVLEIYAPEKRLWSSSTYIFVMWMIGTSLVLYGIATVFMRNQVRPIRRLAKIADLFGRGQNVPRFRPEGAKEVRQAAHNFLEMKQRIERHVHQRTALLAGVSHDLRTPLTRMRLELALLKDREGVEALQQDITDMENMIAGYLDFARGEGTEPAETVDIGALLTEATVTARRGGQAVDLHVTDGGVLALKPALFRRCVDNLIGNSGRYATHLAIRAGRRGETYEILFDDDGPGIPEDRREDVFKPFVRVEDSRNVDTGGVGLGMTIARDAMRVHGGDIRLEDSPLGGLRVCLRLPL